jgi:hypothetical protein
VGSRLLMASLMTRVRTESAPTHAKWANATWLL